MTNTIKRNGRKAFLFFVMLVFSLTVFAQNVTVKGTVHDENNEPIIGVSIKVQGDSKKGTTTDENGKFVFPNVKPNATLIFSYVGMQTQTIPLNGNSIINVTMSDDKKVLEDLIVVGYGTTTKKELISSVATVKTDELGSLPITNITQGLAGRAPGLIVQASGGGINQTSNVTIRGGGTPLVIIDGIIRDYSDFIALNPDDIDQLSLLKDASATAVYGARAAYGALQVTTKKGVLGKTQVEYSYNYSLSQPAFWPKKLNSWERAEYANIAKKNDGALDPAYTDDIIQKMKDGSDPQFYGNTDWRKLVFNPFAPQKKHSVIMTGGREASRYYVSFGYVDQQSLYKSGTHNMQRYNYRVSQTSIIKSVGLKAVATIDGYLQNQRSPSTSNGSGYYGAVFSHVQNRSPFELGVNKYGLPYRTGDNPVVETAADAGYSRNKDFVINGNLMLEWSIPWISGLKLRATGNYRYDNSFYKNWKKDPAMYTWDSKDPAEPFGPPSLYVSQGNNQEWTLQYFAEYTKKFGKHNLNLLGGYEANSSFNYNYWLSRENFQFPIDQIEVGPDATVKNGGGEEQYGKAAYVGQIKYNYAEKYFLEANVRHDGTDYFPVGRRWGTFYSGVAGWSIIDEGFMKNIKEKGIVNGLKYRISYGQVGLIGGGHYDYLSSYGLNNKGWIVDGSYTPTFTEGALPSPDISWYTSNQFNTGIDFSLLKNTLYGKLDYFFFETKGYLTPPNELNVGYTAPLGLNLPNVISDSKFRRAGFDMLLGYRNHIRDFNYDVSVNVTKFDQLWAKNANEAIQDVMDPYKRNSQNTGYYQNLYTNLGYYSSAEDVLNSPKRNGSLNLTGGDIKYSDFNGDGKLDGSDQIRAGKSSFPRANYGILIKLDYKGFFFNSLIQGSSRYDMYLTGTTRSQTGQTGNMIVIYPYQTNFWTPTNTNALLPRLMADAGLNGSNNFVGSDFWLINGAYIRLKDFQLGYNFKKLLLRNASWISKANVSITGQNIFTIAQSLKFGLDPENGSVENYAYPIERVFALNINIGF